MLNIEKKHNISTSNTANPESISYQPTRRDNNLVSSFKGVSLDILPLETLKCLVYLHERLSIPISKRSWISNAFSSGLSENDDSWNFECCCTRQEAVSQMTGKSRSQVMVVRDANHIPRLANMYFGQLLSKISSIDCADISIKICFDSGTTRLHTGGQIERDLPDGQTSDQKIILTETSLKVFRLVTN